MTLTTKAIIYKYTGIYLAEKEEAEYAASDEALAYAEKLAGSPENELSIEDAMGVVIGSWQADKGFARTMSFLKFKQPGWLFRPLAWCAELYTTIAWDIRQCLK